MDRGGRGMRRARGGRPFVRGFYRGRAANWKVTRRPMGNRPRPSGSRDKYESSYNDNDRSESRERSGDSQSGTDKDVSKDKHDGDDSSPIRSKWEKDEDPSEKNDERYSDKKGYYNDSKYYRRGTGYPHRGYRRPYQNNYWDRSDRGRHHSPQSQYRVRPYNSPSRHRRYSRSPDRRRSPSRYRSHSRSRSHSNSPTKSRRYASPKHRSPKRRSPSRRPRSPNARDQSIEKTQTVKSNSDNENNSDDFVEKLKALKSSKTPGRVEYPEKSDDEYWIETDKNDTKDTKKSSRPEYSSKGSKTPGRSEISNNDKDDYWAKSQTSKTSTKNLYSNSWDDSPVREKSVPKVLKTPGRKDYSTKDDDYWINSPPIETKKDRSLNDLYSNKTINKDSTTMYVQELSSSDSEPEKKVTKRARSMSLTNSDKSDTPPLNTEQSNKLENRYPQAQPSRGLNTILKEPPPPSLPATPNNLPVYNSQWPGVQNAGSTYSPTINYVQPQPSQFTAYQQQQQQPVPVQNAQWYQQYGTPFQQFQQYDQKSVAYNPVRSNLEPVEGYQSTNQGLYNIDLKNVVDITKPPPNITPITTVPDTQTKSSQDKMFEMQRETYTTKLFSLKKELEALQIQYDTFKLDNTDGRHNNELKKNRKAQDDVNGKIKGVNNILEVLSTMIPKDSLKEIKKVEPKKLTIESEYVKIPTEALQQDEVLKINKTRHRSTSSSSIELKKKRSKSIKPKKSSKVNVSEEEEENDSKKTYKSKELNDTCKNKKRIEKLPQFNTVYCDSCIHWCQPCNVFPKTAKEYLTHLHSESHSKTLEESNDIELPWHDIQTEPTQPEKNPLLPTKRVPIKGLEFFIGTKAWYCKLCHTWIGDLHCASAHFKSKQHNDSFAKLIAEKPNWEFEWLSDRTRAFDKFLQSTKVKEDKTKENIAEPKIEKSFFDKEPRKEREKEKLRERDRDRDKDRERERERDKYKKELGRKITGLKSQLSPDKEINDTNNVSLSDWMKPVDLPVEKSMITLKESVQKSKYRLHKNKTDEIDEFHRSGPSNVHVVKKQRTEEPKPPIICDKKDESLNLSHRTSKIKLPFIGKMPFAKPITKKTSSSTKDIPNFTVESTTDEPKENLMESVAIQKMLIEKMITAANEKKIEKHTLPVDMDIDDDNENTNAIVSSETDLVETQLNHSQSVNQIHQMYGQPPTTNTLPQDLSTALNMIFPCSESSVVSSLNSPINPQVHNPLIHQHFNMSYGVTNNLSISPERKKKKNAPSQRKRRHMKKIMGKEEELTKDEFDEDDDDKLEVPIIEGPKEENNRKSNGNESDGDELAMLGIDAGDMAAQYY